VLSDDVFTLSENREIFRRWRNREAVSEDESWVWEHYQSVLATRIPVTETAQAEVAFLDCVARLQEVKMRAVKEASGLALAEGIAGVQPGQVASIARARMETGVSGDSPEEAAEVAASLLLEDTENSRRLFQRPGSSTASELASTRNDPIDSP
jgi:hypothetical protein